MPNHQQSLIFIKPGRRCQTGPLLKKGATLLQTHAGMRDLDAHTDICGSREVYDAERKSCIDATSIRGRRLALKRHLALLERGPAHRACTDTIGFTQTYGTCWFNAICNAMFFSDMGNKLMRALYVDWVCGVRSSDPARLKLLQRFRTMMELTTAPPERMLDGYTIGTAGKDGRSRLLPPVRAELLVKALHNHSPTHFKNIGRDYGYFENRSYLKELFIFLGIPRERIANLQYRGRRTSDFKANLSELLQRKRSRPVVILVYLDMAERSAMPRKINISPGMFEQQVERGSEYVLDATVLINSDLHRGGHAIAGVTCGGRPMIIDSNLGKHTRQWIRNRIAWRASREPSPEVQAEQRSRVFWYDWAGGTEKVKTVTGVTVEGRASRKVLVYYNRGLVECLYRRSCKGEGSVAHEWLKHSERGPVHEQVRLRLKKELRSCA